MKEQNNIKVEKAIMFGKGEKINISIELENINQHSFKKTKDFLDTMYKEIKENILSKV